MKVLRLIEGGKVAQDQTARQQSGFLCGCLYQSLYSIYHIVSQPGSLACRASIVKIVIPSKLLIPLLVGIKVF